MPPTAEDVLKAMERYMEAGDGLPVVPPTASSVTAMVAASGLPQDARLGQLPPRLSDVKVRDVAINAVMAGCKPEYMPVVVAAARALCTHDFDTFGIACSTKGAAPLVIVNGPIRQRIGINCRGAVFGPGFRANATIGRAVRLLILNVGSARPHALDKGTLAHSGRFSFCIGEDEEDSSWTPLHVERGLGPTQSAVTVWGGEAPRQVSISLDRGEAILLAMAFTLAGIGAGGAGCSGEREFGGAPHVLVFAKEHRDILIRDGWTKSSIREFVSEHAVVPVDYLRQLGLDVERACRVVPSPEALLVVAAGGNAGRFSSVLPGWTRQSQPVTIAVD
jgi:hypothetical protein